MTYEDLVILVPCHSLEDFPTELPDLQAASLLNSWVVPWHPLLIATAGVVPRWHRADDPPELSSNRLIMLPTRCNDRVPSGWIERVRGEGGVVIADLTDREPMLAAALEPLQCDNPVDPDLAADFYALGFCYLQVELLTRHMRHFSNMDEVHLQREAVAAAKAAVAQDAETARTRLKACFEVLLSARERFYSVECYLIDLCLVIPRLADRPLQDLLLQPKPVNVLVTAQDLEEIATQHPDSVTALREAWERRSADVIGGEYREAPTPLLPLESVLWQFREGRAAMRRILGREPTVWGRRRYGIFPQLPQILQRSGYQAGLHVALDDGLYPDAEYSKVRWEGTNGSVIDAMSRIPLAADGANSYLRFPVRMAESMDNDHMATVVFARWPEIKAPWFEDLRRMQGYAPVLGRFVTLADYFQHTDTPGRLSGYDVNEYLTPYLVQSVARQEADPISRYVDHLRRRQRYDVAAWFQGMRSALIGRPVDDTPDAELEKTLEAGGPDVATPAVTPAPEPPDARIGELAEKAARGLAEIVMSKGGATPGYLLFNPLSFSRTTTVSLPEMKGPPPVEGPVKFVQWEGGRTDVTLEVPGSGFVWLPLESAVSARPARAASTPLAQPNLLRNESFEVHINAQTGGIGQIKGYGRTPNRLSQQLAFRFPRERKIPRGEGDAGDVLTAYSQMRVATSEVTSAGPALGEIVTTGDIVDQARDRRLAGFRQTFRVWRGRPVVELDIELDIEHLPDGDPWNNYYAARFAWNDSDAALTRSVMTGAQGIKDDRFESPHYLEIATEERRTTLLNLGLPFHRKTGERMVDSLLVVAGETRRRFQFVIAIDQGYPQQAALDALTPLEIVRTPQGPPAVGNSGWFFHLNARNVQITRLLGLQAEPPEHVDSWDRFAAAPAPSGKGFALRLLETEGRPVRVQIRCFKPPTSARQRSFEGRTVTELTLSADTVTIDMTAFEIADVELRFD